MTVLCDTSTVQVGEAPELWADAISRLFVPLECEPHWPAFQGRLRAGTVGPLALCQLQASPHTVRRTRRLAAGTSGESYKLSLVLDGEALVEQDGREVLLRPGDFAIYDCSRPYTLVARESLGLLVCLLPRTVLGLTPEQVGRITGTRIAGSDGIGWAAAPFLTRLADLAARDAIGEGDHRVVGSVVDLVESLCASALDDGIRAGASRTELLLRIRAHIEAHLGDPDL